MIEVKQFKDFNLQHLDCEDNKIGFRDQNK